MELRAGGNKGILGIFFIGFVGSLLKIERL
jgi:hypothetical protein